jgi:hypothetical protein
MPPTIIVTVGMFAAALLLAPPPAAAGLLELELHAARLSAAAEAAARAANLSFLLDMSLSP